MSLTPSYPLNRKAAAAADDKIHAAHEKDPRPNALFDSQGRRTPLSGSDPSQECLRQEWIALYGKSEGKLEQRKPRISKPPGAVTVACPVATTAPTVEKTASPVKTATLIVVVQYDPLTAPIMNATVTIRGPVTKSLDTNILGNATFSDLTPGAYFIEASYNKPNMLVELAKKQLGSSKWSLFKDRTASGLGEFKQYSNKCDLFVYEITTAAGFDVPTHTFTPRLGSSVELPPLAGDWASRQKGVGTSVVVEFPEPGDIIAWQHSASDSTGHVGIVSYPQYLGGAFGLPVTKELAAGEVGYVRLTMRRQSISTTDLDVEEDGTRFWHFYEEGQADASRPIVFRRLK